MTSRKGDGIHDTKPECESGMDYLADKSKIEEPFSHAISLIWAVILVTCFFYILNLYFNRKRKSLGLTGTAFFSKKTVEAVEFSENEVKRRLFLVGLEHDSQWCNDCLSAIIDKIKEENLKYELHVVGRSIPMPREYKHGVSCYYSADLSESSQLESLFPDGEVESEDTLVYFAPTHLEYGISRDVEKRAAWDAPINTITRALQEDTSFRKIVFVSSAYVLCENNTDKKRERVKNNSKSPYPQSSVNSYFSHLRTVEDLVQKKSGPKVDAYVLRTYETHDLVSDSPYGYFLRKFCYLRGQRTFVTTPDLLAGRLAQLLAGTHTPERRVLNAGEEMDANDFLAHCTPYRPAHIIYFLHRSLHKPLIHLNHFFHHYMGWTPFGVHFNYSTWALYRYYIPFPAM